MTFRGDLNDGKINYLPVVRSDRNQSVGRFSSLPQPLSDLLKPSDHDSHYLPRSGCPDRGWKTRVRNRNDLEGSLTADGVRPSRSVVMTLT